MEDNVTQILQDLNNGDERAADKLLPLVYDELRRLAKVYLSRERSDHTLQPTALVHEAYLRLIDHTRIEWQNRAHFFAMGATLMRRILVDHARHHLAEKSGGGQTKLAIEDALSFPNKKEVDLIALDEVLLDLERLDQMQSRIVELRFFGGLTIEETAEVLRVSDSTIKREWVMAKAWLYDQLTNKS